MDSISVRQVTKTYRVGVGRARVREMLPWPFDRGIQRLFPKWWGRNTFDALRDVSFTASPGSSVGLVGHNGAGKTTLLKVISGVTEPTRGALSVSGRVAALLDVLVGFHPDLTGRENAYLLGAMQGLGRNAMDQRIERILAFAAIEEAADTPLKRYSSGMVARLAFGIFTAIDVEILLVDEVLAVGDAAFQRKCIAWLDEYRSSGGTLLFVSHNLGLVRSMTERAIWLDHGTVKGDGPTATVLADYARAMEHRQVEQVRDRRQVRKLMVGEGLQRWGAGGARVDEVHVEGPSENGDSLDVSITFEASEVGRVVFCVAFVDESGREVGASASPPVPIDGQKGQISCSIRPLPLRSGIYFPVIAILSPEGLIRDRWKLERGIVVDRNGQDPVPGEFGPVDIAAEWGREPARRIDGTTGSSAS